MPVYNLAADGESNAGSFVLAAPVQALKNLENAIAVFLVEPDAVVFDGDPPGCAGAVGELDGFTRNPNHRTLASLLKLQSVANQVLE